MNTINFTLLWRPFLKKNDVEMKYWRQTTATFSCVSFVRVHTWRERDMKESSGRRFAWTLNFWTIVFIPGRLPYQATNRIPSITPTQRPSPPGRSGQIVKVTAVSAFHLNWFYNLRTTSKTVRLQAKIHNAPFITVFFVLLHICLAVIC